jgi:integrase
MAALTKRTVDAIQPAERDVILWDDALAGFGVRVKPSGVCTYIVQYRNAHGHSRRHTIGRHGPLTPDAARRLARQLLGQIAGGADPTAERKARREVLTLAQFAERYMVEHALVKKKASSARSDELTLRLYILPKLGALPLAAIGRPDVARIHHELRDKPTSANRVVALLSKMMNLAELWGLRPDHTNPCRHIRHYPESRRRRFLSGDELARLGHALEHGEQLGLADKPALDAIRLLLLTGARCGEILNLRWEHVDRERWVLRLPDSKTGAKEIPVGRAAQLVLKNIERTTSPWVIPGRDPRAALVNLNKAWRRIRKHAEIEDVRLHDLRRTAASAGASAGLSLETVGQILGHTQAATTKRYAFLFDDAKREAADLMSARLADAMKARPALRVVRGGQSAPGEAE